MSDEKINKELSDDELKDVAGGVKNAGESGRVDVGDLIVTKGKEKQSRLWLQQDLIQEK